MYIIVIVTTLLFCLIGLLFGCYAKDRTLSSLHGEEREDRNGKRGTV